MRSRLTAVAVALAALAPVAGAQITNGSFETSPSNPGAGFIQTNAPNTTTLPGWTVSAGSVDYIGTFWQAAEGVRSLDMSGASAGTIFQDVALLPGSTYRLTFAMSSNGGGTKTMNVFVNPTAGPLGAANPFSYTASATHSTSNMEWSDRTLDFVAPTASTRLTFQSLVNSTQGPALDDVRLTLLTSSVPEPATLALVAGGLLGVLGVARARRRA